MADRETEYHTELTKINHTNYVRNSRAIVVMWAIFTVVFAILNIVVFIQPQWIGDDDDTAVHGFFGIWRYCIEASDSDPNNNDDFVCHGTFYEFDTILDNYFKATSLMVALSCLLFIVCILSFVLFFLLNTSTVLMINGWLQLLAGFLMAIACIVYPAGWDNRNVQLVCGQKAGQYELGTCSVRWGYILAIVLIFDAFILSILAFVLAAKQAKLLPGVYKDWQSYPAPPHRNNMSSSRGQHLNDSYYLSELSLPSLSKSSRKSTHF